LYLQSLGHYEVQFSRYIILIQNVEKSLERLQNYHLRKFEEEFSPHLSQKSLVSIKFWRLPGLSLFSVSVSVSLCLCLSLLRSLINYVPPALLLSFRIQWVHEEEKEKKREPVRLRAIAVAIYARERESERERGGGNLFTARESPLWIALFSTKHQI